MNIPPVESGQEMSFWSGSVSEETMNNSPPFRRRIVSGAFLCFCQTAAKERFSGWGQDQRGALESGTGPKQSPLIVKILRVNMCFTYLYTITFKRKTNEEHITA